MTILEFPNKSIDVRRFMGRMLIAILTAAAVLFVVLVADGVGAEEIPLRELRGRDYTAASETRGRADLMRADLERRLFGPPKQRLPISQEEIDMAVTKIEQAYQEVMERYPHTEIAAYCAMRLSGFYGSQGEIDKAEKLREQTIKRFSGTSVGNKAVFEMGLSHLQRKHDPAEAIKWFSRIPTDDKLYLSAQQQLIKCELQLRQDDKAQDRAAKLKSSYPQYAQEV
jgi:hypothetical protein